jgi:hypothetical protein
MDKSKNARSSCYRVPNTRSSQLSRGTPRPQHRGLWLSLVERLVRDEEAVGSNPTSPIKRAGSRHERNRPHYHCVYRIHGGIFSRRDSDPLIALRGSGSSATLESFQNTPNYRISRHRPCPHNCATWFNPNDFWSGTELAHWHVVPANRGSIAHRTRSIPRLATTFRPRSQPHSLIFERLPRWERA